MAILKIGALLCTLSLIFVLANAQSLNVNFYQKTCPTLSSIVQQTTASFVSRAPTLAPALLRMHFHDCFVRGCDGSVLINSTSGNRAERDAVPNGSLRGFQVIDAVKAAVESKCPNTVSCADIVAIVARDAVVQINGPSWPVPLGRRDGRVSTLAEANLDLPPPFANISALLKSFSDKGLSAQDLVILSGSHTIGISHCPAIDTRINNFAGTGGPDPSMDRNYAVALRRRCPPRDNTSIIQMDPGSSQNFDTSYYANIARRRGLFESDAALLNNPVTRQYVQQHSTASGQASFASDFGNSMVKMGRIGVLTGSAGEIRRICSAIN